MRAGDSGKWLCAHLGGKMMQLCLCVLVTPECVLVTPECDPLTPVEMHCAGWAKDSTSLLPSGCLGRRLLGDLLGKVYLETFGVLLFLALSCFILRHGLHGYALGQHGATKVNPCAAIHKQPSWQECRKLTVLSKIFLLIYSFLNATVKAMKGSCSMF